MSKFDNLGDYRLCDFLDDWRSRGLKTAISIAILRFRWKHDLRRQKEIWLADLPIEYEFEKHCSRINPVRVKAICDVLGIGEWEDFYDDTDWYEGVKVIGSCGFSNNDLHALDVKEVVKGSAIKYILIPSQILEKIYHSENCCIEYRTTDRSAIPATVKIHYGKGEVPYWMTDEWIRAQTRTDYDNPDHFGFDPFSCQPKPLAFT